MPSLLRPTTRLSIATLLAITLACGATAGATWVFNAAWWDAWLASVGIGVLCAAVTLPWLAIVISRASIVESKELPRMAAIVIATGLARVLIVAGGVLLAIRTDFAPAKPVFAFAIVHYALLTIVEVWMVSRVFWQRDTARLTQTTTTR